MEQEMSKHKQMCSVRIGLACQEDRSVHQSKSRPFMKNIFEQEALCSLMPVIAVTAQSAFFAHIDQNHGFWYFLNILVFVLIIRNAFMEAL